MGTILITVAGIILSLCISLLYAYLTYLRRSFISYRAKNVNKSFTNKKNKNKFYLSLLLLSLFIISVSIIPIFFYDYLSVPLARDSALELPLGFVTRIEWDNSITKDQSISISATLKQHPSSKETPKNPPQPDNLPQNKYGPDYEFFFVAQLDASTFEISPKEQQRQSVNQETISFNWIATPTRVGKQAMNITIRGIWIPKKEGARQIEEYLANKVWHVNVVSNEEPYFTFGQINLSALLLVLITSIVQIPVWDFIKHRFGIGLTDAKPAQESTPPKPPKKEEKETDKISP